MLLGLSGERILAKINEQFQISVICVSVEKDLVTGIFSISMLFPKV